MAGEIWIPESAREEKPHHSLCLICGQRFPKSQRQQFERHVAACSRKHPEHGEDIVAERDGNAVTGLLDPERYAFVRRRAADGTLKRSDWLNTKGKKR